MASLPFPPGFHATKFIDIPPKFFIGHLIGGKITKDMQKLTGAEILFLQGNQGRKPRKLEIRGSLNDVKLAEEFLQAFFKHQKPSQAKPSLKIRTASAIFWIYLSIFRDYGLKKDFF